MASPPDPPSTLPWPHAPLADGVVALDRMTQADATAVAEACAEAETQRWLPLPHPYTVDDAREFVAAHAAWAASGQRLVFALRPAGTRDLAGATALTFAPVNPEGQASVGYWTHPAFRRRGLAWRAVRLAARYAFTFPGLRRVEVLVQPGNAASRRVAERAGATYEGLRRRGLVHAAGATAFDAHAYSLLPEDLGDC